MKKCLAGVVLVLFSSWPLPGSAASTGQNDPILQALSSELSRSVNRLRLDKYEAPYFIAYRLTDIHSVNMRASYGALTTSGGDRYRALAVDVRVGNYVDDNTSDDEGFYYNPRDDDAYSYSQRYAPLDNDTAALRQELWLMTDYRYKSALEAFIGERGRDIQKVEKPDRPDDFSKIQPMERIDPVDSLVVDRKRWENILRAISARFKSQPLIHASDIDFMGASQVRYLLTSESTRLRTNQFNLSVSMSAETRGDDGMPLSLETVWKTHKPQGLPDSVTLARAADSLAGLLLQLRVATVMEPYTGPAIIKHGASGVFFHEALGHRLEGHRTRMESEGHTFKDKMGQKIIPTFLNVYDDPTLTSVAGSELYGYYQIDDEGVPAQRVSLIEHGILKNFLLSRMPTKDIKVSNGHGRADMWSDAVSRMGSTFVVTDSPLTYDQMRSKMLDECRKEGKEYGLIFEDIASGETNTSSAGVQTLRISPRVVKKVYVSDGHEELVRGAELIGTPLAVLESIQAAGDDLGVFNGVCGAESGWVPVSAVAPSVLVGEIEVQRMDRNLKRGPILPPPLHDPEK